MKIHHANQSKSTTWLELNVTTALFDTCCQNVSTLYILTQYGYRIVIAFKLWKEQSVNGQKGMVKLRHYTSEILSARQKIVIDLFISAPM